MIRFNGEFDDQVDREIAERVRVFLNGHNVPSLRRLAVSVRRGTLTLRGRVGTFYEKQLSHQCLKRIEGVRQLDDRTVVIPRTA